MKLDISANEYINGIKDGTFTAEEFTARTMEQISKLEPKLHAFISVNNDAVAQARIVDKKIRDKEKVGAFYGMP
ncbi:MAG TPA: Asp-tRNA(Asn)/Glu-tRNA(Gln) amidotransferase subunit GatA, partial [Candidatus Nitrosotenuis sp.]|nr:Asp-tRNA(Asn)/Glu-tRNA(Gln) amidotransferase subunit GatA [Candidatus Nitrosotenuis sp.]